MFHKLKKYLSELAALFGIFALSVWIRTRNLHLLKGKYLTGLDPYFYYRHARDILIHGHILCPDFMRNPPIGASCPQKDFLPYFLAGWHKFLAPFTGQPQIYSHILYPAIIGSAGLIFFYLFLRKLDNKWTALFGTAFLATAGAYLYRTTAGFADHEALAMLFFYTSLWLFVCLKRAQKSWQKFAFGLGAGIFAALLNYTWGAFTLLMIILCGYIIIELIWDKNSKEDFVAYALFGGIAIIKDLTAFSLSIHILLVAFYILLGALFILVKKLRLQEKIKYPIRPILAGVIGSAGIIGLYLTEKNFVRYLILRFIYPAGFGKVDFTTSEIIGTQNLYALFGPLLILAIFGLSFYVFGVLKENKKIAIGYALAIFFFSVALLMFNLPREIRLVLLFAFGLTLLSINYIKQIEPLPLLGLIFFFYLSYLGNLAPRFGFVAAPAIAFAGGLFFSNLLKLQWQKLQIKLKYIPLLIILVGLLLIGTMAKDAASTTQYMGSGLPGQWENAMIWIKDNTPKDSVIAHWWDYGYWTEAVAERPAIQDGGKPGGGYYIYTLARYGMIAYDNQRALEYFAAHNTSYLLFSSEEIPKYHAFSFLGSDKNGDRESTIGLFKLQGSKEVRNGTKLYYSGGWMLDDDLVLENYVLPKGRAGIGGFVIELDENGTVRSVDAILIYNGKQLAAPISCVYTSNGRLDLDVESQLGCIKFVPLYENGKLISNKGVLYLSPKVLPGLFARLYILEESYPEFELVYQDNYPLAIYGGSVIGPIKIWKINYPAGIKADPIFLAGDSEEYQENYANFRP